MVDLVFSDVVLLMDNYLPYWDGPSQSHLADLVFSDDGTQGPQVDHQAASQSHLADLVFSDNATGLYCGQERAGRNPTWLIWSFPTVRVLRVYPRLCVAIPPG